MRPDLKHRLVNLVQSVVLIAAMAGLGWLVASAIWGPDTALWALIGIGAFLALAPSLPLKSTLGLYGARPIAPRDFPEGWTMLTALAERAGLERVPDLYYLPSALPNAFSLGRGERAAVVLSDGLIRLMTPRELKGVMAHEISHIAHRDLWIMGLADIMARLTSISAYAGLFLLLLNLPLILAGAVHVPWIAPILLALSPTVMSLLQMALSRTREFAADAGAARLTGDPEGLARALVKLERATGRFWEEIFLPGRRMPDPSLLRSHPETRDRVARLATLEATAAPEGGPDGPHRPRWPAVQGRPRWRRSGLWY